MEHDNPEFEEAFGIYATRAPVPRKFLDLVSTPTRTRRARARTRTRALVRSAGHVVVDALVKSAAGRLRQMGARAPGAVALGGVVAVIVVDPPLVAVVVSRSWVALWLCGGTN
jgi:hypothetical protein